MPEKSDKAIEEAVEAMLDYVSRQTGRVTYEKPLKESEMAKIISQAIRSALAEVRGKIKAGQIVLFKNKRYKIIEGRKLGIDGYHGLKIKPIVKLNERCEECKSDTTIEKTKEV